MISSLRVTERQFTNDIQSLSDILAAAGGPRAAPGVADAGVVGGGLLSWGRATGDQSSSDGATGGSSSFFAMLFTGGR
eukprot:CAMPEP_0198493962 /NCGR_PEP_ID=MMETSP1462-20131121/4349_1 /TAXON_ID=1333877 /ORGANISM="Brandtodinium nutriculum, Strain RCC3387" /LENGTH=77 /DNA_ID=CAMNT_0044222683 /DNA_START=27 /DNA_END=257 /DNA_ORIENTATION=+